MPKKNKSTPLIAQLKNWYTQRETHGFHWILSSQMPQDQNQDALTSLIKEKFSQWYDFSENPLFPFFDLLMNDRASNRPHNEAAQQQTLVDVKNMLDILNQPSLLSQVTELTPEAAYYTRLFYLGLKSIALVILNQISFSLATSGRPKLIFKKENAKLFLAAINHQILHKHSKLSEGFSELQEVSKLAKHHYLQQKDIDQYLRTVLLQFNIHCQSLPESDKFKHSIPFIQNLLKELLTELASLPPIVDVATYQNYSFYQTILEKILTFLDPIYSVELREAFTQLKTLSETPTKSASDLRKMILTHFQKILKFKQEIAEAEADNLGTYAETYSKDTRDLIKVIRTTQTPCDKLLEVLKDEWSDSIRLLYSKLPEEKKPDLEALFDFSFLSQQQTSSEENHLILNLMLIKYDLQVKQSKFKRRNPGEELTKSVPRESSKTPEECVFQILSSLSDYYCQLPLSVETAHEPIIDQISKTVDALSPNNALKRLTDLKGQLNAIINRHHFEFKTLLEKMDSVLILMDSLSDPTLINSLYYAPEECTSSLIAQSLADFTTFLNSALFDILNPKAFDKITIKQFTSSLQWQNSMLEFSEQRLIAFQKNGLPYNNIQKLQEIFLLSRVAHFLKVQAFENNKTEAISTTPGLLTWITFFQLISDLLLIQTIKLSYYKVVQPQSLGATFDSLIDLCILLTHTLKIIIDNADENSLITFLKFTGHIFNQFNYISESILSFDVSYPRIELFFKCHKSLQSMIKLAFKNYSQPAHSEISCKDALSLELKNNVQSGAFKERLKAQFVNLPPLPAQLTPQDKLMATLSEILEPIHHFLMHYQDFREILNKSLFDTFKALPKKAEEKFLSLPGESWTSLPLSRLKEIAISTVKEDMAQSTRASEENLKRLQTVDLRDFQLRISPAHGQEDEETVIDDLKIINDPMLQSVLNQFDSPNIKGLSSVIRLLKIQDIAKALQAQQFEATPRALSAVWTELSKRLICKIEIFVTNAEKIHQLKSAACETMAIAALLSLQALETDCLNPLAHSHKTPEEKKKWLTQQRQMTLFKEAAYILIRLYKLYDSIQQEEPINIFDLGTQAMDITDVQKTWWTQIWNFLLDKKNSDTNKIAPKEAVSRLYQLLFEDTHVTQQPTQQAIDAHQQKIAQAQAARLEQEKQWRAEFQKKERQNSNPKKDNTTPSDDASSLQSSPVETRHQPKGALLVAHAQTPRSGKKKHSKERKEGQFISNLANKPKRPKRLKKATQASVSIAEKPNTPTQTASLDSAPAAKEATSTHTDAPKHPSKVKAARPFFAIPSPNRFFQPPPSEVSLTSSAISPELLHPITQRFREFDYFIAESSAWKKFQMVSIDPSSIFAKLLTFWLTCANTPACMPNLPKELKKYFKKQHDEFLQDLKSRSHILLRILVVYTHLERLCANTHLPLPVSKMTKSFFKDNYDNYPLYDRNEFLKAIDRCREQIKVLYSKGLLNPDEVRRVYLYLYQLHYLKIAANLCLLSIQPKREAVSLYTMFKTLVDNLKIRMVTLEKTLGIAYNDISKYRDCLIEYATNLRHVLELDQIIFSSPEANFNMNEAIMPKNRDQDIRRHCLINIHDLLDFEIKHTLSMHAQLLSYLVGNQQSSPEERKKLSRYFNQLTVILEHSKYLLYRVGFQIDAIAQPQTSSVCSPNLSA